MSNWADDERNAQRSDRLAEMYENSLCKECCFVDHSKPNCYEPSILNENGCTNFKPNTEKL